MGGSRKQVSFVPNSKHRSQRDRNYSPRLSRHVVFSPLKILVFYLPFRRVSWIEGAVRCTRGDMYLISSNKIINGVLREGRKLDSEGGRGGEIVKWGSPLYWWQMSWKIERWVFFLHQSYEYTYVAITYENDWEKKTNLRGSFRVSHSIEKAFG